MNRPDQQPGTRFQADMIDTVVRASERAATAAHQHLKEGLDSLATITTLAPWLGLLGTVIQIANSFVGCSGERSTCMAAIAENLSQSLWPAAWGLLVGLVALSFRKYLTTSLQALDMEMKAAIPQLVNQLTRYQAKWRTKFETGPSLGRELFGGPSMAALEEERAYWHRSMFLAGVALLAASCAELAHYFVSDSLPLESSAWTACKHVLFVLPFRSFRRILSGSESCIASMVAWQLLRLSCLCVGA